MKKFYKIVICIFSVLIGISCSKEEYDSADFTEDTNEYYVQYDVVISSQYIYKDRSTKVTVTTEKGDKTFYTNKTFSEIFGPFKVGDVVSVKVVHTPFDTSARATSKIYVSKNQEPFALKSTGGYETTYTIE